MNRDNSVKKHEFYLENVVTVPCEKVHQSIDKHVKFSTDILECSMISRHWWVCSGGGKPLSSERRVWGHHGRIHLRMWNRLCWVRIWLHRWDRLCTGSGSSWRMSVVAGPARDPGVDPLETQPLHKRQIGQGCSFKSYNLACPGPGQKVC